MWRRHRRRRDEDDEAREVPSRGSRAASPGSLPGNPAEMLAAAREADRATVARLIGDLEERAGNEAVGRLVEAAPATARSGGTTVEEERTVGPAVDVAPEDVTELGTEEAPPPTRSGTDFRVEADDPIVVTGTLRQAAHQLMARTEAGSVTSQVADVGYVASAETGRTRIVAVTVIETLRMPVWADREERPPAEQAEWDRFYAALLAHEREHIAIDRRHLDNLHRRCLRKTVAEMDDEIDRATAAADTENRDFDTTTDHGRNAGTRIAPPPEEEAEPGGAAGPHPAPEPMPRGEGAPAAP